MRNRGEDLRFTGMIGGFGTESGLRVVFGSWRDSPFGRFTDVMIQNARGDRTLIAPSQEIADFVSGTYTFDEVLVERVTIARSHAWLWVIASTIEIGARIGGTTPLGRALRLVPRPIATNPTWLTAIDPLARVLSPGTRTAGSAGSDRTEFYGVTTARSIDEVSGEHRRIDFGGIARMHPRVDFGFGSPPARPSLVAVTTTIRMPPAEATAFTPASS
ncbi:hypothetical protein [Naasia lichenicola]|uniref:Uncharacterized protein n=1 Tax=Naasia lichenicola TaxID=2565933 RepID=A0A4V3WTT5_9MICO|nr:hypothetical protein [Naasia lichenicola]THG33197.1 hypothetical protein E6C64_02250 [Naasia lichenicola]